MPMLLRHYEVIFEENLQKLVIFFFIYDVIRKRQIDGLT